MASNNYYNDQYRPSYDPRHEHPMATPPTARPSLSPFDDSPSYPYAQPQYSHSSLGRPSPSPYDPTSDPSDPFADASAVPLRKYNSEHDSTASEHPMIDRAPVADYDDPFVRDAKPGRRRKARDASTKEGWFRGKITWVCFVLSIIQLAVFLAEIIKNAILTGSPIEIHPQINPMLGPSPYVMINMGARYVSCMHNMPGVQDATLNIEWPCPNATSTTGDSVTCSLSDLCGFSGVPNPHVGGSTSDTPAPNQWFRFITPIFLHAGFIHIGFNLLLQLTLGRDMEKSIGSIRFFLVYFSAGIFGFVLGGNFAASGIASTGCSGSLFGILALTLLDLLYTWKDRPSPVKDLMFILVDVGIAFVLGLLPGLDNFSHIGGFLMGLVLGVCILHSPPAISRRLGNDPTSYASPDPSRHVGPSGEAMALVRDPLRFFKGRRPLWWAWWLVRAAGLVGILVGFIVLLKNFYVWRHTCSWCKYLSCIDVSNWCDVGNLQFNKNSSKRDLLALTHEVFGSPFSPR